MCSSDLPEGYPLAYEVMPGNTADKTTLRTFLSRIESLYGTAQRTWIMDRGIPTEAVLEELQAPDSQVKYCSAPGSGVEYLLKRTVGTGVGMADCFVG